MTNRRLVGPRRPHLLLSWVQASPKASSRQSQALLVFIIIISSGISSGISIIHAHFFRVLFGGRVKPFCSSPTVKHPEPSSFKGFFEAEPSSPLFHHHPLEVCKGLSELKSRSSTLAQPSR
ncbi:MAG: hypothetical protein Q9204_003468 [Flavoplaca sp. TL-2023a]